MPKARKRLIAIDGNSLFYRAFFGVRYLSTSDGKPTNAIYGLTTMLLRVLDLKPDYVAVAFDTPQPTFRHVEYKLYKAQRKAPPDDLIVQAPMARELVRAFNIPVIELPGFEADDVIGAMAVEAEKQDIETTILTGDMDTLQLVNDHISVMTTLKGASDTVVYDAQAVIDKYGIQPKQLTDYKGLKGDTSDNIPGVPGIGEKTAVDLIQRYGSLENLLEHVDELPDGRVKTTLQENKDIAILSKHLGTVVTDLPLEIDLESYRATEPDFDMLRDLFVRLEFKTMLKRLPQVAAAEGKLPPTETASLGACRQITSEQELNALIASLQAAGEFSVHCHTTNEKSINAELIGISFCAGTGASAYVQVQDPVIEGKSGALDLGFDATYQAKLSALAGILESEKLTKYCHDYKLNYAALALRGVKLNGVTFDTMLAAYLLDPSRSAFDIGTVGFEQLAVELPGVTTKKGDVQIDDVTRVCGEAEVAYRAKPALEQKLKDTPMQSLLTDVELPIAPILADMELIGVKVDVKQLETLSVTLNVDIQNAEQSIYEQAGEQFNIGSTKQLQTILYEKMGLSASKKTKTGFSTSASAMEELAAEYPIVADILRWRELTKIKSTYADALPKLLNPQTGRIHTSLNQAVTSTGRLSSSDPNLQNIPIKTELGRQIRRAFVASGDNVLLSADYSQIELRVLAHITGDPNLVHAFEHDEDIHAATASVIFNCKPEEVTSEMRRRAKTINFAVIYGMADFTLGRTLGIGTREAREYITTYFARFAGVKKYTDETIENARNLGYVETLLGRRRYIPDINSANFNIRSFAERAAVNMPIQGTAADMMKLAMIRVHNSLAGTSAKMLLQVHDELLFEVPPSEVSNVAAIVRDGMEHAYQMRVPIKVDVKSGTNWAEMKELSISTR